MLYNILKVLGVCSMISAYFGGFIICIAIGLYIVDKLETRKYQKQLEFLEKYQNSVYNFKKENK